MSQHDFEVSTGDANTGVLFRAAMNAALQALATNSSGNSAPTTTRAFQFWADSATGLLKIRNAANTGWITVGDMASAQMGHVTSSELSSALSAYLPAGTKMLFYQDAAPSGWTIDNTLDDKAVYITKGSVAGGQAGGGVHSAGSWTITGLTADNHTLTIDEIPAHTHTSVGAARSTYTSSDNWYTHYDAASNTGSAGGGLPHSHTVTHTPGWRPAAYCCIICSKD